MAMCLSLVLVACNDDNPSSSQSSALNNDLIQAIEQVSDGEGLDAFILPASDDFGSIPQDPNNTLTAEKVVLGQMLYHETALATEGVSDREGTWSCASCHHAAAGFKAGVPQGIAEGGEGFGSAGEGRTFATGFDGEASDPALKPDIQPVTSPAVLNVAYQDVMLWNGQFGNTVDGIVNSNLAANTLATEGTPKAHNNRQLSGLEIQAIAGTGVHRLSTTNDSILQTNSQYQALFEAAYPSGSNDVLEDAGKAIAAFERTIFANQAPFQKWLKGDAMAMSDQEKRGALLFFGEAGCVACHTSPALSSKIDATENEIFFAIGFSDFDPNDLQVSGVVDDATSRGRGGFTGNAIDDYKFKVPQLYNLADTSIFGHGASFRSIKDVVKYKNTAVSQKPLPEGKLDSLFQPLNLDEKEIDDMVAFLTTALHDDDLKRYVPASTPSGQCSPVNDAISRSDLGC